MEAYNEALGLVTDENKKILLISNIGTTLGFKGDYDKGLDICNNALDHVKSSGALEEGAVLGVIGSLHEKKCENETALDLLKKAPSGQN